MLEREAAADVVDVAAEAAAAAAAAQRAALENPWQDAKWAGYKWTVYRGVAYDLTSFMSQHPAGSWLLNLAVGRDSTALFESYHLRPEVAAARLRRLPVLEDFPVAAVPRCDGGSGGGGSVCRIICGCCGGGSGDASVCGRCGFLLRCPLAMPTGPGSLE